VLVGTAGGGADEERAAAATAGIPRVSFGANVLRVETAAVAGAVLLTALRAGLVLTGEE
jgi:16S rRNA U1498 N3-methylase RsmE